MDGRPLPRVQCSDSLLFADPEESVEHASVAHLHVLGLALHLQPGFSQVDGKRPCRTTMPAHKVTTWRKTLSKHAANNQRA